MRRAVIVAEAVEPLPIEAAAITDHALVRWLERAEGFDLDAVRRDILTPCVRLGMAMGARRVHRPEAGVTFVLRGPRLVTVLPLQLPTGAGR